MSTNFTRVEKLFAGDISHKFQTNIPYITVDNFPLLGKLAALRFLEWVGENPEGVISLPTGKTPEYFIEWVKRILAQWDTEEGRQKDEFRTEILEGYDLKVIRFTNRQINTNFRGVCEYIDAAVKASLREGGGPR